MRSEANDAPPRSRGLDRYRAKRHFDRTPEPEPEGASTTAGATGPPRFVVHEHHATRLHWDLRLERDGALRSWAIPHGVPWSPERDHLAVHTEDHPIEYLEFSGEIPEGEYGAGRMSIWDEGVYEPLEVRDDKVVVLLVGYRIRGRYALFPIRGDDWMIHRVDPPSDPERRPLPTDWRPMRPVPGDVPSEQAGWGFEIAWVGARVLVMVSGGRAEIAAADGGDLSDGLPEIRALGPALGSTEVVLDGVVVAVDRGGRPTHQREPVERRVRARAAGSSTGRSSALVRRHPVGLCLVDLLWLDGHPLTEQPYSARRQRLESLGLVGAGWQTPGYHRGDGEALLDVARREGLGGLVAKRLDSPYRPGETSSDWLEIPSSARS